MASSRARGRRRRYLTAFYLWMSAGGVIGGIAAGLIAPYVFNWVAEYPILIALAVLCRPGLRCQATAWRYPLLRRAGSLALVFCSSARSIASASTSLPSTRVVGAAAIASVLFWRAPLPFAAIIAFVLLANHTCSSERARPCPCAASSAWPRSRKARTASSACSSTAPRCTAASASATPTGAGRSAGPSCCSTIGTAPASRRPSTRCARASTGRSAMR